MDKRKLRTKKPIINVTFNERDVNFDVELGRDITSDQVYVSVIFIIETLAEALKQKPEHVWNQLLLYRKGKETE